MAPDRQYPLPAAGPLIPETTLWRSAGRMAASVAGRSGKIDAEKRTRYPNASTAPTPASRPLCGGVAKW